MTLLRSMDWEWGPHWSKGPSLTFSSPVDAKYMTLDVVLMRDIEFERAGKSIKTDKTCVLVLLPCSRSLRCLH